MVGTPLSILQLVVYFKYRKAGVVEESNKQDMEKGNLEIMGGVEKNVTNHA